MLSKQLTATCFIVLSMATTTEATFKKSLQEIIKTMDYAVISNPMTEIMSKPTSGQTMQAMGDQTSKGESDQTMHKAMSDQMSKPTSDQTMQAMSDQTSKPTNDQTMHKAMSDQMSKAESDQTMNERCGPQGFSMPTVQEDEFNKSSTMGTHSSVSNASTTFESQSEVPSMVPASTTKGAFRGKMMIGAELTPKKKGHVVQHF